MGQVAGKVAMITGGARGIGGMPRTLAREGARIAVTDIDVDQGEAVAADVAGKAGCPLYPAGRCRRGKLATVVEEVEGQYGRLDVMVANPEIAIRMPIVEMSLD